MAYEPEKKRLTGGQKVGFSFMLIFACLAIGLGLLQIRTTIYAPFTKYIGQAQAIDQAQLIFDETVRLQRIDTDRDGLNDFEELNFYQTSPYLSDTDSDGRSDKREIDEGTDPLCPEGKDCGLGGNGLSSDAVIHDKADLTNPLFEQAIGDSGAILGTASPTGTPSLINIGAMLQDPSKLRAALLASGQVSAEDLALFNDDKLLDLAQQALKSQENNSSTDTRSQGQNTGNSVDSEQLEKLLEKPEELRALLLSTGKMTKEQLDQIDDNTLISVTKELVTKKN